MAILFSFLLGFFELIFLLAGFSLIPFGFDFRSSLLLFGVAFTLQLIRWAIKRADRRNVVDQSEVPPHDKASPTHTHVSAAPMHNCPCILPANEFLSKHADAYIAFDLETTGLSPSNDCIIEIGAVKVLNGAILEDFSTFVDPGCPIPANITAINHITDTMVAGQPVIRQALTAFLVFAGDMPLVAHNASFDRAFLVAAADLHGLELENPFADSLQMARKLFPNLPNKKLATVCEAIGYQIGQAHRALDDAKAVHAIVLSCAEKQAALDQCEDAYQKHIKLDAKIREDYQAIKQEEADASSLLDAVLELCQQDFSLVAPVRVYCHAKGWPDPAFPSFYRAIVILSKRGDYDAAISVCRQAVDLDIPDKTTEGGMRARLDKLIARRDASLAKTEKNRLAEVQRRERVRMKEEKKAYESARQSLPSNKRQVIQMSPDGETQIKRHESVAAASRETGVAPKGIRDAATGKQKHAGGFVWRYADGAQSDSG